jgi:hypothetical protein
LNDCFGLRVLAFEEDSCVHLVGGFCRSALTSIIFPDHWSCLLPKRLMILGNCRG